MTVLGEELKEKYDGCRFIVEEYPQVISLGYYYVVKDTCNEMISIMCDTDYTEAEEYCIFLNKLYDMYLSYKTSSKLFHALWSRYENSIEELFDKYEGTDHYEVLFELDTMINSPKNEEAN